MSRQLRLMRLPLVGMMLLSLLTGIYLFARKKRSVQPDPSALITKHTVNTNSDDALQYWTADKMRHAKPAEMPHIDAPDQEKEQQRRPPV